MEDIFYVYYHVDIDDHYRIVYVGKGKYGRAWDVTRCSRYSSEHQDWLKEKSKKGQIPEDWVQIFDRTLSSEEAFTLERQEINRLKPKFNMQIRGENNHWSKLKDTQVKDVKVLLNMGYTHKDIATKYGVSRAAISMINTGRNWKHV